MAKRTKSYGINNPLQDVFPTPVIAQRAPKASDTNYELGQSWVDKTTQQIYALATVANGSASWVLLASGSTDLETLTGDTGGALLPTGGNINILGGNTLEIDGSGSTLTVNTSANGYPITPFVVGTSGEAGYTTVQAALDAANTAGGGTVYIQPGSYTEDLTFYDQVFVVNTAYLGVTAAAAPVIIIGIHTPPTTGQMSVSGIRFESATHIFDSVAAGSAQISVRGSIMAVTNGYTFNLPNWTGRINCNDCGSQGVDDGFLNNPTGGLFIFTNNGQYGAGNANPLISNGDTRFDLSLMNCPVNITGGTIFYNFALFPKTLSISGTASGTILLGNFTGSPAIDFESSGTLEIGTSLINSSSAPVITGSGSGIITITGMQFLDGAEIAGTLTLDQGEMRGGNVVSRFVVGESPDAKYQTIQSAITAAGASGNPATVVVHPGTYTEDLTLSDTIDLVGNIADGVTITGTHTPPASGRVALQNLTLVSATDVLNSAVAGTTDISILDCEVNVTNGYLVNLLNWTGSILINDCMGSGANDGVVNNTGGSSVIIKNSDIGEGATNTLTLSGGGGLIAEDVRISCPVSVGTGTGLIARRGTTFGRTVSSTGTATLSFSNCRFSTGATPGIDHNSSGFCNIACTSFFSTNDPVIDGAGAGAVQLTGVDFQSNNNLAATLTVIGGTTTSGAFETSNATSGIRVEDNGFNASGSDANIDITMTPKGTGDVIVDAGNVEITSAASHLSVEGGAVTDFIGTATLAAGTVSIANTNIAANDRIFLTYTGSPLANSGDLTYTISAGASFTIASTNGADANTVAYFIVRQL